MAKAPKIRLCDGKSCRKKKAERAAILDAVDGEARVEHVGCQKICDGPVVGLELNGTLEWFEEVDSKKSVAALRELVKGGPLAPPLAKRRVAKRSGRLRR